MPNLILIRNEYPDSAALLRVLNYVTRSGYIGGYALDPSFAYRQMTMTKNAYHKADGTQLLHYIISFSTADACRLTMDEMFSFGFWAARQLEDFQTIYALHSDTHHFHLHLISNTVSFQDGHRYCGGLSFFWQLRNNLQQRFPRSDIGLFQSFPRSSCNQYMEAEDRNEFLRIG